MTPKNFFGNTFIDHSNSKPQGRLRDSVGRSPLSGKNGITAYSGLPAVTNIDEQLRRGSPAFNVRPTRAQNLFNRLKLPTAAPMYQ